MRHHGYLNVPLRRLTPALAAAVVGMIACQEELPNPVVDQAFQEVMADQVVYGMLSQLTTDGVRTGTVRSDSAYVFEDSSVNHLFGVEMELYAEGGATRARLTSATGVMHQRSEELIARGGVILRVLDQNVIVETEELRYDPHSERISSDSASTFRRDGQVQRGTCFRSDLEFTNWSVCQPVGDIVGRGGAPRGGNRP